MCIGERRIDLNRSLVTLQSARNIADFLQGVAEIRMRIGEHRLNSNRFFVMIQRVVQTALLLEHRGEIGMSSSEVGKNI